MAAAPESSPARIYISHSACQAGDDKFLIDPPTILNLQRVKTPASFFAMIQSRRLSRGFHVGWNNDGIIFKLSTIFLNLLPICLALRRALDDSICSGAPIPIWRSGSRNQRSHCGLIWIFMDDECRCWAARGSRWSTLTGHGYPVWGFKLSLIYLLIRLKVCCAQVYDLGICLFTCS